MILLSRIEISDEKFQKELRMAHERYNKRPNTWSGNESLGRVLRFAENPVAKDYIEKALEIRLPMVRKNGSQGWELIVIGNYYRMIGKLDTAQQFFQEAYKDQKSKVGNINVPNVTNFTEMQGLIKACFLLERFEEAVMYGRLFHNDDPSPKLLANSLASIAEAILTEDKPVMEAWLESIGRWVQSVVGKGELSASGGVGGLDLYEVTLRLLAEIEKQD